MKVRLNNITRSLFIVALVTLSACTGTDQPQNVESDSEVKVTFTEEEGASEKYLANIAIDGMACEMMCGTKIAGELNHRG